MEDEYNVVCALSNGALVVFGTLANFGNEQQNVRQYYYGPDEVQKLGIFGNKVFVHDNDSLYCRLCCSAMSF